MNQSKERATGKDKLCQQINSYLDDYRAWILEVRQELIAKGHEGNCIQIKERLQHPATLSILFFAELEKYCDKRQAEVGVRITQLTANKYHRVLRYLGEYVASSYWKEDILLSDFRLRVYRRIQHLFTNRASVSPQRSGHSARFHQELYSLLPAQRMDRERPVPELQLKEEHNKEKDHLTKTELETLIRKAMPERAVGTDKGCLCFLLPDGSRR